MDLGVVSSSLTTRHYPFVGGFRCLSMLDNKKIKLKNGLNGHPFHLTDESPWPLFSSISAFGMVVGAVMYFHQFSGGWFCMIFSFFFLLVSAGFWWYNIIIESTFEGHHTKAVQKGLKYGMALFIVSELMFFVSFFWAFFYSSLSPAIQIGCVWPPKGIETIDPWRWPLLNTMILVTSGFTVTWSHHAVLAGERITAIRSLILTIGLAALFTFIQGYEYVHATFTISDGIYGSTFYMATGFHGLHVLIGTFFLSVCLIRLFYFHFTRTHHVGFVCAIWYWHFVDVVWLFLFVFIYWWGGK